MKTLRQKVLYVAVLSIVVLVIILAISKKNNPDKTHIYSRVLMGTVVELTLSGADVGAEEDFAAAAEAAFSEITRLEEIFSSYKPASDVSRISRAAGKEAIEVAPEVVEVVESALKISVLSGGAFDPTIGSLARLWSFSGEVKEIPSIERARELAKLVDYRQIFIEDGRVGIKTRSTKMNLGGIAKGYIVGKAVDKLREAAVDRMIVKAGGDMFVFSGPGGAPFEIGIIHPREKGRLLGKLKLLNGAIATSGDYERFFITDGVRYHHILDPMTGFPARRSVSATVTSVDPALADALSTALFVMGHDEGLKMIEEIEGVEALVVDAEGKLFVSSGFKGEILISSSVEVTGR
jgi:thiamine biosynthesis lipoprotein